MGVFTWRKTKRESKGCSDDGLKSKTLVKRAYVGFTAIEEDGAVAGNILFNP
jgi:hypothetical protein